MCNNINGNEMTKKIPQSPRTVYIHPSKKSMSLGKVTAAKFLMTSTSKIKR